MHRLDHLWVASAHPGGEGGGGASRPFPLPTSRYTISSLNALLQPLLIAVVINVSGCSVWKYPYISGQCTCNAVTYFHFYFFKIFLHNILRFTAIQIKDLQFPIRSLKGSKGKKDPTLKVVYKKLTIKVISETI